MNKILVTGASSFLGDHVVRRLNEQGRRVRAPRFEPPMFLVRILARALGLFGKLTGKPAMDTSVLQVVRRYAWYDTTRARTELGWEPRPLKQTLEDTIRSLRDRSMDGLGEQSPRNRS